jgi:hypothetical protein
MDSLECSSGAGAGPPDLKLGPWRKRRRRWFEEVGMGAGQSPDGMEWAEGTTRMRCKVIRCDVGQVGKGGKT